MNLNRWNEFPRALQRHLSERLLSRKITVEDLNKLRIWIDSQPDVPEGLWFKDFKSFKLAGEGPNPLTFLDSEQVPYGEEISPEDEGDSTGLD